MKKVYSILLLWAMAFTAWADSSINVEPLLIPEGKQGELVVYFSFDAGHTICNYQMEVVLPQGVSVAGEDVVLGPCHTGHTGSIRNNVVVVTSMNKVLSGTSGLLLKIPIEAPGLPQGTTLQGSLVNIKLGQTNETSINLSAVPFTIDIVEDVIELDENSTTAPEAAEDVNVRVRRTINANSWSTICLPFAMSEAQCKAAFGNDVKIGDFDDYDTTEDADENTIGITVKFKSATAIEANHPYIILVSTPVSEFTVDGVNIEPDEEPSVSFGYTTGKGKNTEYHPKDFKGTYVADFDFYAEATSFPLFLSGNKFYYATENTRHMKAFRAYFDFDDYLSEAETASSRIVLSFDDATGISSVAADTTDDVIYTLGGQRVDRPAKGLYIRQGKKVIIK